MKTPVIADSSALVAQASTVDHDHNLAVSLSIHIKKTNRALIIPGEIFAETLNVLGKKVNHELSVETGWKFLESKELSIMEATLQIRKKTLEKFQRQPKSVSFTDCLVMAFADEFETNEIFGFDETFAKNGYKRLGIDK
ncbi:PIN domain-containing protein [Candidatus Curtissbacteria bacterium]|nr:PIN domain-containing protein [Candidatus Curtissbacteria bacterium]